MAGEGAGRQVLGSDISGHRLRSLLLATCLATGWATQQKDPERIKVLLPLDAVFPSLALVAVAISWSVIAVESPSGLVTGVWIGLYSFVAAGSTILYFVLTRRSR